MNFNLFYLFLKRTKYCPPVIDNNLKYLYFVNPKVCQQSIVRSLLKGKVVVEKDEPRKYFTSYLKILLNTKRHRVKTFTLVRNPYTKTLSAYTYLRGINKCNQVKRYKTFKEFCMKVLASHNNKNIHKVDGHFLVQSRGLFKGTKCMVDKIFKIENLNHDWKIMCNLLNLKNSKLPHINKSKKTKQDKHDINNQECREIIYELYKDDFKLLEYNK